MAHLIVPVSRRTNFRVRIGKRVRDELMQSRADFPALAGGQILDVFRGALVKHILPFPVHCV